MMLVALLSVPLVGAVVLRRCRARSAAAVHGVAAGLTLALAAAVAAQVLAGAVPTALGELLRVDSLSAWMLLLVALVGALAALARRPADGVPRGFAVPVRAP